ncbi:MAG: sensor histidine kinase [Salibacteraceae bacterium]
MNKLLIIVLSFALFLNTATANSDSLSYVIKKAIVNDDLELALKHVNNLEINNEHKSILQKQAQNKDLTYSDYLQFLDLANKTVGINVLEFSDYIKRNVVTPPVNQPLNYDFAQIKWLEITWLVDDSEFEKAAIEQQNFEEYINAFDPEKRDVKRAKILAQTYHFVMTQIQGNGELGVKLTLESAQVANDINDTALFLLCQYYYSDFLITLGELDLFIETCEQSLAIENNSTKKSPYYLGTIKHLIDAYLYKGVHLDQVYPLIIQLLDHPYAGATSLSYIVNYLEKIEIPSAQSEMIFERFGVSDPNSFCVKIDSIAKEQLNNMDYYFVLYKLSLFNEAHGNKTEALLYLHDANKALKRTYSKELSESLASYETTLLKQSQQQELEKEEQKTELSLIIAILSFLLFLITITLFWQRNKKEKLLTLRNQEITSQRDEIAKREQEKALLLKEIHHRVKNNFQIVSSLLELQSISITDQNAKNIINEGKNRINSMALIHKRLYENDDLKMYFDEYIRKLVGDLSAIMIPNESVKVEVNVPHISFGIDTAIPLGLIINELVTNCLKYGSTNPEPEISVSIEKLELDLFLLTIADNGIGLPEDFDISSSSSLGLKIVLGLSKQLRGDFKFKNQKGTKFMVHFKDTNTRI